MQSSTTVATSGGGLSTVWILLISLGGVLALTAVAYTTMRLVQARGPAA